MDKPKSYVFSTILIVGGSLFILPLVANSEARDDAAALQQEIAKEQGDSLSVMEEPEKKMFAERLKIETDMVVEQPVSESQLKAKKELEEKFEAIKESLDPNNKR